MSYRFVDSFRAGPGWNSVPSWSCSKAVWRKPLLSVQWINSWWWTEELSETCRVSRQNIFVKLVHLVGFITKEATVKMNAFLSVRSLLVFTVSCRSAASGYICSKDVWTRNKLSFAPACRVSRIHLETLKKFLTLNWRPLRKLSWYEMFHKNSQFSTLLVEDPGPAVCFLQPQAHKLFGGQICLGLSHTPVCIFHYLRDCWTLWNIHLRQFKIKEIKQTTFVWCFFDRAS